MKMRKEEHVRVRKRMILVSPFIETERERSVVFFLIP